jgi:hypothetical protein
MRPALGRSKQVFETGAATRLTQVKAAPGKAPILAPTT